MPSTIVDRVTGISTSVAVKAPCRVATTAAITLSGEQTIDSVAVVSGDRVLVKDQASSAANGIYVVDTLTWDRSEDLDAGDDIVDGTVVFITEGTTYANNWFVAGLVDDFPIDVGIDDISWTITYAGLSIVAQSTETTPGVAEIATQAEVTTGTDDERFVTPLKLATHLSTYTPDTLDTAAITGRTEDTAPVPAADYFLTYDASATALKKVLLKNVSAPVIGSGRGVVIKNNAGTPNSQLDITADEIVVKDSNNHAQLLTAFSETLDITASGANGLDTGTEAGDTWYYIWAISKDDGTADSLLSSSSTAPTMPATYTHKALIGAVRNNGSSNFVVTYIVDRNVFIENTTNVISGVAGATTYASVSIATYVPPIAKIATGFFGSTDTGTVTGIAVAGSSAGLGAQVNSSDGGTTSAGAESLGGAANFRVPMPTASTIYWKSVDTGTDFVIAVTGYVF